MTTTDAHENLLAELEAADACDDAFEWFTAGGFTSKSAAWMACPRADWMLFWMERERIKDDKKYRKFACWCCRNTPIGDGRTTWDLLTDPRSRNAVEVAERFVDKLVGEKELEFARSAAWSVAESVAVSVAVSAAESAAGSAAASAASAAASAARSAVSSAARSAVSAAVLAARSAVSESAARSAQANALREIFGNPFEGQ